MKDLRSGIEHLKQAKAHMSKANGIMSDYVSKLKELEEENARLKADYETALEHEDRLKAELDDWKGNAEGLQPDEYMKLPLDADGVPIRIGDYVWYVGMDTEIIKDDPQKVAGLVSVPLVAGTYVMTRDYPDRAIASNMLTHNPPDSLDSWEKLEEDMMRGTSCLYFGCTESEESCWGCPHGAERSGTPCWKNERLDILRRAKKLAGIEEEAQR